MTPTAPIPASLATACAAHDRHRLDVLDALLDEAAPSAVRELLGAALDLCASLRADRDALAAKLDAAPKVCAIHSYEHGPGPCMTCGAWPPGTRELIAACRTRIAGLEQAADERSKEVARVDALFEEARGALVDVATALNVVVGVASPDVASRCRAEVARLTARVAELEARPVLTVERLAEQLAVHMSFDDGRHAKAPAKRILAALGPVTLPLPAQDMAERLLRAFIEHHGALLDRAINSKDPSGDVRAEAMSRALASLGAPPTSPPAARPVFAGVSEDELIRLFYVVGTDGIDHGEQCPPIDSSDRNGLRAVLARLEVSLVAPVDPIALALNFAEGAGVSPGTIQRSRAEAAMRATLTAAGIPVTPEVGK